MSLSRFIEAQDPVWDAVLSELRAGRKTTHWMWFVFPQHRCLGQSERAKHFGISGLDEARTYLRHETLGRRLIEASLPLLSHPERDIVQVLGEVDAMKLRSSATLFQVAQPASVFGAVLTTFFGGSADVHTLSALQDDRAFCCVEPVQE